MAPYTGEFLNGKKHGRGKVVYADNSWYDGYFKFDLYDGEGELHDPTGLYHGAFSKGLRWGEGMFMNLEGVVYEGGWREGRRHGVGKLRHLDGSVYHGAWAHDKPEGKGRFKEVGGVEYEGGYVNGLREGRASWKVREMKYEGGFAHGEMRGVGSFTWEDGGRFTGRWREGGEGGGEMPKEMEEIKSRSNEQPAKTKIPVDFRPGEVSKFVKNFRDTCATPPPRRHDEDVDEGEGG
ncbi:MAG: hypothetical protein SGPRY_000871 [Prymnesium sp.]